MKRLRVFLQIICVFACSASVVLAQTEFFSVKVSGGVDTTPPTTPVLLSATPVASTQIDIAWSAVTDDVMVSGYSILRDGLPIATTTLLSYSDTGLAASTTYSYAVRAFDPSLNYSTTSNALATSTLEIPSPPPTPTSTAPTSSQGGTAARVVADSIVVSTGRSTTSFSVLTAHYARLEVRWGRTGSYELGYVVSSVFSKDHAVLLTDLEPGTMYEYEIIGYTPVGMTSVLKRGVFSTDEETVMQEVLNVEQFTAVGVSDDVSLSWRLPEQASVSHVRVVRSHLGFPEHPQDGAIVYQGTKESVTDESVLSQYSPVYYTAFVFDQYGNVSSGAVAVVYAVGVSPGVGLEQGLEPGPTIGVPLPDTGEATSSVAVERFSVEMKMPRLTDIVLRQGDLMYLFTDTPLQLDAAQAFTVSVPRSVVAGNLKSIIATIQHPTEANKAYSFLLRINRDRTAYEARVSPLFLTGRSLLVLEIYDYEAFVVGTYQTPITFIEVVAEKNQPVLFPDVFFIWWPLFTLIFVVLLALLFLFLFLKKRAQAEDNN